MKCPQCGGEIPARAEACPSCSGRAPRRHDTVRIKRFDAPGPPGGDGSITPPAADAALRAEYEETRGTIVIGPGAGPARADSAAPKAPPAVNVAPAMPERLGPYKVVRFIGRGGMGAVYEGWDEPLSRRVALKLLAPEHAASPEFVARFLDEGRAAARIAHQNVVIVYAAGSDAGRHYIAMEYVEGESLQELVQRTGPLEPRRAMGYAAQAAKGLQAAWLAGITHRDVKPANLMLAPGEVVKVMDFGLAKLRSAAAGLTGAGQVMGSPHYMSPEQGTGGEVDFRADIYSLGATIYFMLTGRAPYEGDDPLAVIYQHVSAPPPRIPRAPIGLERLFAAMMAKSPDGRFGDYGALVAELDRLTRSGLPGKPLVERGWSPPKPDAPAKGATTALKDFGRADAQAESERVKDTLSKLDDIMGGKGDG